MNHTWDELTREDILNAIAAFPEADRGDDNYVLIHNGKQYPARALRRFAYELKYNPEKLTPADMNGRGGKNAQEFFKKLGFEVKSLYAEGEKVVTEWFIAGNPKKYDLINAFKDLGTVDWKQSTNVAAGDTVYIYVSDTYQAVKYKCRANKVDLQKPDIDDQKYNISGEYDGSYGRYMELEMIEELQGDLYGRSPMEKHGFGTPQSPVRVTAQVKDYLDLVQGLQHADEMDPDKHDGCYEFMREIVKAYSTMSDYSQLDYKDLNLVYFSCVGTWTYGYDKKKRDILESHLPQGEKDRLVAVLDSIQEKAKNKEYENSERNQPSIGMFGTGFKSFVSKADNDSSRQFIQMLVDILPMDDDAAMFDRAAQVVNSSFKGMRAASASVILHTLKPHSFPIINGNQANGNVFVYLGVDLKRPSEIGTYIDNCRAVKSFRDSHFTVKNYRIYDRAIWEVGKGTHTEIDYLGIMEYLEENANAKYVNPDSDSISAEDKEKYLELKARGQYVVDQYKKIASLLFDKFGVQNSGTIQWLDGSNTKLRRYLWAQLKEPNHMDEPYSLSFFTDIDPDTKKARFRACLEVKNDGADKKIMAQYHSYFDMEQNPATQYLAGSNELGNITLVTEPVDVIKQKVESREYKKVQPSIYINWSEDLTNDTCEELVIKAVETVLPYYKHVIDGPEPEWWPSKEEYDPGLTIEQWVELLKDREVVTENNLKMFAMMLDFGRPAACSELAERYGETKNFFNAGSSSLAKRVADKTKCSVPPERINKDARWWPILYVGRHADADEKGSYIWKMRDELKTALGQIELPEVKEKEKMKADKTFGLNTILYGPPGTGKTYNTVRIAVSICEPELNVDEMEYADVLAKYKELKKEGRIEFTTFHQSYGYEEFIEGIKPVMVSATGENQSKDVQYDVIPGVFKTFCENARKVTISTEGAAVEKTNPKVWCLMLDGTGDSKLKSHCFANNEIRIGWPQLPERITYETEIDTEFTRSMLTYFQDEMEIGDIVVIQKIFDRIDAIGIITGDYEYDPQTFGGEWPRKRSVKWMATGIDESLYELNGGKHLGRPTIYPLNRVKADDIIKIANKNSVAEEVTVEQETKPYVFIIDEINRGNISKIFGELITLIEVTKRAGADEAMETTLPYSGDPFSVPDNVYILGTMNTADRSIALMDTALRRRFDFEEMMPDTKVIEGITVSDDGETLDVAKMLDAINRRIEYLYDREHTIGHAFFTRLRDNNSMECLADIFKNNVVPLLQEYFYEDYEKIQLVLGDNDKSSDDYKFILDKKVNENDIFKKSPQLDLHEKTYEIQKDAFDLIQSYIEITEARKAED